MIDLVLGLRRLRWLLAPALVATACLAVGTAVASAATSGSGSGSGSTSTVQQGINVADLPGATPFGNTPASTPETVSFVLREQNLSALEQTVLRGVSRPISVSQFASAYGQTPGNIAKLRAYLGSFGISTQVLSDDVDVTASGTAGEFDKALSVSQFQYHVPGHRGVDGQRGVPAQDVHGSPQAPELPSSIAQYVLAIFGLSNYAPLTSQTAHVNSAAVRPQEQSPSSCEQLVGLPNACHTPTDFASMYKLDPLYQDGAYGQGETIGIVTFAALDPGAPQYFWKNVMGLASSGRTVNVDNVDGGPGAPSDASGTGETDLDAEQSGGLAPDANVIVYQAPNSDPGFFDAFFTAASQNKADSVSCSWGESETYLRAAIASGQEDPAYQQATDEAFLEFAVQGQSGFVSSGDSGAYDASGDLGTTDLSVDTPGNSPYITSSGGTTLPWSATISGPTGITAQVNVPAQRIWGWDYLWQPIATVSQTPISQVATNLDNIGGGGGGFSVLESTPSYQRGVPGTTSYSAVPWLTPTDYQNVSGIWAPTAWSFNATPPTIHGSQSGRAEPDLAANADPYTGYLLYEPSWAAVGQPTLQGGWGGTSFVGPQLNGSTAVIDSLLGRRVGLWNTAIYSFATGRNSPFSPLNQSGTGNDNLYYSGTPGTLFNEGAGLGTPNLAQLAGDFGRG
jgi:kumamolisin